VIVDVPVHLDVTVVVAVDADEAVSYLTYLTDGRVAESATHLGQHCHDPFEQLLAFREVARLYELLFLQHV